ncbi:MAG: LysE family transporter, partial [Granulosicoccus sp.]|nr:LysE family transporter [Granulosicoccus sp.]
KPLLTGQKSQFQHFLSGYALQVTNPKAISFWLAIASVNAVSGASLLLILLFVIGGMLVSFTCHGTWAVAMSSKAARRSYAKLRRWVEAFLGGLFTLFAIRLLTTVD